MENRYQPFFYPAVNTFLEELPPKDRAKIRGTVATMETGDLHSPKIKTLRGLVKELIVKEYRILFFIHEHIIYFVRAFRKKTRKTPAGEYRICRACLQDVNKLTDNIYARPKETPRRT